MLLLNFENRFKSYSKCIAEKTLPRTLKCRNLQFELAGLLFDILLQADTQRQDFEDCQKELAACKTACSQLNAQVLSISDQAEFDAGRCRKLENEVNRIVLRL